MLYSSYLLGYSGMGLSTHLKFESRGNSPHQFACKMIRFGKQFTEYQQPETRPENSKKGEFLTACISSQKPEQRTGRKEKSGHVNTEKLVSHGHSLRKRRMDSKPPLK
jgi:hypothetical protein